MTSSTGMCTCAAGCARNPMADPGVFGDDCSCWCHSRHGRVTAPAGTRPDLLLAALAEARRRKDQADRDMRLLLAYAREIAGPRPYRLADLAEAAGMSISGIRTAYTQGDIQHAARLLGGAAQRHLQGAITTLLADGQHAAAREPRTAA
jgi:hypothetical protein